MAWFAANWFQVLILVAFIAMHMFGHGGHGGHGGDGRPRSPEGGPGPAKDTGSGGHQH